METDTATLRPSENAYFQDSMGETLYNLYTDVVYIVPDAVAQKLLPVRINRFATTDMPISYKEAMELELFFREHYIGRNGR